MRLIDADALRTRQSINSANFNNIETIQEWIDAHPTIDAVPVIRCKDCGWFDSKESWCTFHGIEIWNEKKGFCCWAEKKIEQ